MQNVIDLLIWKLTSNYPFPDSSDSDYSHIYGRLPLVNRAIRKFPTKPLFLSQWE